MDVIHDSVEKSFTLVELLVALAIAAIIVVMAVPSFRDFTMNNRLTAQANDFVGALTLARSAAVKRNTTITVCSSNDQSNCTGSAWQDGWIVRVTDSGELIRSYPALSGSNTLVNSGNNTAIEFDSSGFLNGGVAQSFLLCDSRSGESGRQITLGATGRPGNTTPYPLCS